MVRRVVILLALLLTALNVYSQSNSPKPYIKLQFDTGEIYLGDAVVLEIESTGLLDPIDFEPLLTQATLVRETTGTRIAVIGGKVVEIKIRRMDLIPKRTGAVVIGPLMSGEIASNSVHVNVLDATRPDWQPQTDDLQIITSLSPQTTSVNQQVQLTIELIHRYPINNESIQLPALDDFAHRELITDRRTFKGDNREWFRTEWRYLIFPKRSGTLDIGNVNWAGTIAKSRTERAEFTRSLQALRLLVKPAEGDNSQWWLPAESLQLTEAWSTPPTELRAGDELERTIKVSAKGVLAGQIPSPVVPESRAIQQTLINTERRETLTDDSVTSTADFTYRVKAQSPIPVFLDTIRIPWWNTKLGEAKEAIIPARRINVGLPDRADVLTKLALQETGVNKFKHWLQTTDQLRLITYLVASVCALLWLTLVIPWISHRLSHRYRLHRHFSELYAIARTGSVEALYQRLMRPDSQRLLAGSQQRLIKLLEKHLFSSDTPRNTLPLSSMLKHLNRQARSRTVKQGNNSTRVLAEL